MQRVPLFSRLANAVIMYVVYIWQMLWPHRLAVFYPFVSRSIGWQATLSAIFLIAITTVAVLLRGRRPYFVVGWLWYLSMLLPVIGVIQVGLQSHADRYTYLPQIGLYLLVTWAVADTWKTLNAQRSTLNVQFRGIHSALSVGRSVFGVCFGLIIIVTLAWTARSQAAYWRDSEVLWTHAIAVTNDNYFAHSSLADLLMRQGRLNDAIAHCREALRIWPDDANAENNLGLAYLQLGNERDAIAHFENSLRNSPSNLNARTNLAWLLATSTDASLRETVAEQLNLPAASFVIRSARMRSFCARLLQLMPRRVIFPTRSTRRKEPGKQQTQLAKLVCLPISKGISRVTD